MDYGHYTTRTITETVALCNVLANRRDEEVEESGLRDLLQRFELGQGPLDVDGLTHLATRLRRMFLADDLGTRVEILNDLIALYQPHPRIVDHDDQGHHLHYQPPGAGHLRSIGASMTMALTMVLCDFGASRFGVCPSCEDVFVDSTRNGRQRFCSRPCANRVHVASHRARAAAASDATD